MSVGRDGIAGLVLLALSLAMLVQSFYLPYMPLVPVGPGFYPRIVLSFLALSSIGLIVQDWRARQARQAAEAAASGEKPPRKAYELVVAAFVVVAAYVLLLPLLGFRIASVLFLAALQITLEWPATPRRWLTVGGVALGTTIVTYLVFETYLLVLLPRGTWTSW